MECTRKEGKEQVEKQQKQPNEGGADLTFEDVDIDIVKSMYDEDGNRIVDADFSRGNDPVDGDGEFDFGLDEDDVEAFGQIHDARKS